MRKCTILSGDKMYKKIQNNEANGRTNENAEKSKLAEIPHPSEDTLEELVRDKDSDVRSVETRDCS